MPNYSLKKVLIIGGSGFIGGHLARSYMEDNVEVFITSRYYNIVESEKSIKSDYSEASFVEILGSHKFDRVFYLSGNPYPAFSEKNPTYDIEQSIIPVVNLMLALVKTNFKGSMWFSSSVAVYGKTDREFQSESDICQPLSSYGIAKIACEEYLKLFARNYNLSCGSLRIFSTFGEGLERQIVYDLYRKAISNSDILSLIGSGREERDLCYVGDQVVRIKLLAERLTPSGDVYNIGSGVSISTHDIAEAILSVTGQQKTIMVSNSTRGFDGYQWKACTKKFCDIADNPSTDFLVALEKTITSYQKGNRNEL
jgi:UDP-glucose 4-epimerase